jgi:hypothetical protein
VTKDEEIRHNAVVTELANTVGNGAVRAAALAAELASVQAQLAAARAELEDLKLPKDAPQDGDAPKA